MQRSYWINTLLSSHPALLKPKHLSDCEDLKVIYGEAQKLWMREHCGSPQRWCIMGCLTAHLLQTITHYLIKLLVLHCSDNNVFWFLLPFWYTIYIPPIYRQSWQHAESVYWFSRMKQSASVQGHVRTGFELSMHWTKKSHSQYTMVWVQDRKPWPENQSRFDFIPFTLFELTSKSEVWVAAQSCPTYYSYH